MNAYRRHRYKYIDDTGHAWGVSISDYLAEAGKLERIPVPDPERIQPPPRNYHFRHIKVVGIEERPGQQKYRAEIIVNERNPSKLMNAIIDVGEIKTRCIKYVGEQRRGS